MQFLRTVFWVVLAVIGAIFSLNNWTAVTVNLWGGMVMDTHLPVLLIITFLLGLLPMLVVHRATRWRLRRKLENANRTIIDSHGAVTTGPITTLPPGAAPIVPPPGVA